MLGTLILERGKESHQGLTTFVLTELKKFPATSPTGKYTLVFFMDCKSQILENYTIRGVSFNSETSSWERHEDWNRVKRRGLLTSVVSLQDGSAHPHRVHATAKKNCESLFWVSSTFCIITRLRTMWLQFLWTFKKAVDGKKFNTNEEIKEAVYMCVCVCVHYRMFTFCQFCAF